MILPTELVDAPAGRLLDLTVGLRHVGGPWVEGPSASDIADIAEGAGSEPDLSTYSAQLTYPTAAGKYEAVWTLDDEEFVDPPFILAGGGAGQRPSVDDVALLLRTRTVDGITEGGLGSDTGPAELTTFTEETRPRASEVERIIETSYGVIGPRISGGWANLDDDHVGAGRHAVALYAVLMILASFFRETTDEAAYRMLRDEIDAVVGSLNEAAGTGAPKQTFGTVFVGTTRAAPVSNADPVPGIDS
jgi:hypothetical protein